MGLLGSLLNDVVSSFDASGYDWYCDDCDAPLDDQIGFSSDCGTWTCTECGCLNYIDEGSIRDDDCDDDSERLSIYDAADIWLSHGKDEDYMFGYTEEELEDAL